MLIHFVVNPWAARFPGPAIDEFLRREFPGDRVRVSSSAPGDLGACGAVVAVGGDGTVHRLLENLAGGSVPLGILPCGRANDFARALGLTGDLRAACAAVRAGRVERIDLLSVNGRRFATCGGLGLVTAVSARADSWRRGSGPPARLARRAGPLVYPAAFCREVAGGLRPLTARIDLAGDDGPADGWDHGAVNDRFAAVVVNNQPRFGGRFSVCPHADNRDGRLDLCAIRAPRSRFRMLGIGLRALRGRLAEGPGVFRRTAAELRIATAHDTTFSADGEPAAWGRRFHVRVEPAALPVFVPSPRPHALPRAPEAGHAA